MRAATGTGRPRELRYNAVRVGGTGAEAGGGHNNPAAGRGGGWCGELNCVPWLVSLQSWRAHGSTSTLEIIGIYTAIALHVGAWLTALSMSLMVVQKTNDDDTPEDPAEFVAIGSLVTLTVAFLVLAGYWLVQCGECCFCSGRPEYGTGGFKKEIYAKHASYSPVMLSFISSGLQASVFFDGLCFLASTTVSIGTNASQAPQAVLDTRAFVVTGVVFKFFLLSIQNSLQVFVADLDKQAPAAAPNHHHPMAPVEVDAP